MASRYHTAQPPDRFDRSSRTLAWVPRTAHLDLMPDLTPAAPPSQHTAAVQVDLPAWVSELVDFDRPYDDDQSRMRLAIAVSRANVERGTGGPFGALHVRPRNG